MVEQGIEAWVMRECSIVETCVSAGVGTTAEIGLELTEVSLVLRAIGIVLQFLGLLAPPTFHLALAVALVVEPRSCPLRMTVHADAIRLH